MHLPYGGREHVQVVSGQPALEARGLSVAHPSSQRPALQDITVSAPVGSRIALVGHNGAGKSTLLKAAAGLLPVIAGELRIYGQPVGACHHRVAYLPQRAEIDWRFPVTVGRLVLTGRYVHLGWFKRPSRQDHEIAEGALDRMGLADLAARQIGQLSGGQQQRALLARALAQDADLLLLDEPLNAVDAETRAVVSTVLAELQRSAKTVLMATHDLGRMEAEFDGAVYLHEGRQVPPPPGSFSGAALDSQIKGHY